MSDEDTAASFRGSRIIEGCQIIGDACFGELHNQYYPNVSFQRARVAEYCVFSVRRLWRSPAADHPARPTRWDWTAIVA